MKKTPPTRTGNTHSNSPSHLSSDLFQTSSFQIPPSISSLLLFFFGKLLPTSTVQQRKKIAVQKKDGRNHQWIELNETQPQQQNNGCKKMVKITNELNWMCELLILDLQNFVHKYLRLADLKSTRSLCSQIVPWNFFRFFRWFRMAGDGCRFVALLFFWKKHKVNVNRLPVCYV